MLSESYGRGYRVGSKAPFDPLSSLLYSNGISIQLYTNSISVQVYTTLTMPVQLYSQMYTTNLSSHSLTNAKSNPMPFPVYLLLQHLSPSQ